MCVDVHSTRKNNHQGNKQRNTAGVFLCYLLFSLVTAHLSHRLFFISTYLLYTESGVTIQRLSVVRNAGGDKERSFPFPDSV